VAQENRITSRLIWKDDASSGIQKSTRNIDTLRGKLSAIGGVVGKVFKRDFKGAAAGVKELAGGFGGMSKALLTIGGVVGVFGLLVKGINDSVGAWKRYTAEVFSVKRLTGFTAEASSRLVGVFRLTGSDVGKATTAIKLFAKQLYAAQQGTASSAKRFDELGIALKDTNGQWRSDEDVLNDVRDAMSTLPEGFRKTALMTQFFGRSGEQMARWLSKTPQEMRDLEKAVADYGLVLGSETLANAKKFAENQRLLSFGFEAIKVNAAAAFVPLINWILPLVNKGIKLAAGWLGRFRELVEKKGWAGAIAELPLPIRKVYRGLEKAWDFGKKFGSWIIDHQDEIVAAFGAILDIVQGIASAINSVRKAWHFITERRSPKGRSSAMGRRGGGFRRMASGGSFVTAGPEMIMVGDNPGGREHVEVTPLDSGRRRRGAASDGGAAGAAVVVNLNIGSVVGTDDRAARQLWNSLKPVLMREMRLKVAMSNG
jgi:hypothetical protein